MREEGFARAMKSLTQRNWEAAGGPDGPEGRRHDGRRPAAVRIGPWARKASWARRGVLDPYVAGAAQRA